MKFIHGHNGKAAAKRAAERLAEAFAQSDKLCGCGCGELATIATYTDSTHGIFLGEPLRFIRGHHAKFQSAQLAAVRPPPAEVKLCECDCGEPAPIATTTNLSQGAVKGHPQRFVAGHHVKHAANYHLSMQAKPVRKPRTASTARVDDAVRERWRLQNQLARTRNAMRTPEERIARSYRIAAVRLRIDPELVVAYRAEHDDRCDICGRTAPEANPAKTRLCIDHDHATGEFRGLLCSYCNVMLGNARDMPDILLAAIKYLRQPPAAAFKAA